MHNLEALDTGLTVMALNTKHQPTTQVGRRNTNIHKGINMRTSFGPLLGLAIAIMSTPALADEADAPSAVTINGTATVVSDYRFRGISQTDRRAAVQGSITVSHSSGVYASVWGSSVDDYVTASLQSNQEIDLIVGFKKTFGGTTVDVGALYYLYPKSKLPGDLTSSNFIEPYLAVSQAIGPVTAKATINYAPKQKALALNQTGPKQDSLYIAGDLSAAIPNTPIGLTAHLGHSKGPSWLATTGRGNSYTDWGIGATATFKAITIGIQYVDTNTTFVTPTGRDASKGGVVATLGVSF
jgi:uncharacterized protein (TIGR02001 family)